MSAKFGARRIAAFLAALRETGNQTIAAERAKVSRSWVSLHRASDPEFRRAMDEAIAEAKRVLRDASSTTPDQVRGAPQDERDGGSRGSNKPPSGWGFLDGAELVVRGTGGAGGGKRVQIARARLKQWSPRIEDRFLAALAATCNVKAACSEVGMTPASAYNHRNRWPAFARRWDAAVEEGYVRLEAGLIHAAGNFLSGEELPVPSEDEGPEALADSGRLTGMTVDHAIHLLHMHKHQVHRIGGRPGLRAREPDIEEVRADILRKVAAIKRADARRLARDQEEWARRREVS